MKTILRPRTGRNVFDTFSLRKDGCLSKKDTRIFKLDFQNRLAFVATVIHDRHHVVCAPVIQGAAGDRKCWFCDRAEKGEGCVGEWGHLVVMTAWDFC